jgi:hypothetical protein
VRLDQDTLVGWFCIASPSDQMALDQIEQRAWRKALKIWKSQEGQRWAMHNRATLHRLMYLAEESEHRGGHLRKAFELYHRLAQEEAEAYRPMAQWALTELEAAVREAAKVGDDEMVAKSLLLISQTSGMVACEDLQEQLMLAEIDDLALLVATLVRDLLPYQGVVHAPPRGMLASTQESAELDVLPPAVRLAFRLVPGSRQRRRVDAMVAELCGLLSQSLFKAGDGRPGKKWQGEAQRWEPKVAEVWTELHTDRPGDEAAARVEFSSPDQAEQQGDEGPRSFGPWWLGIHGKATLVRQHEAREEWLEAVRFLGIAVFPVRRFAVYRNLDTGELGVSKKLPLKVWHYLWQTGAVMLISLALLGLVLRASPDLLQAVRGSSGPPALDPVARQAELAKAIDRLKHLAQVEAALRRQPAQDSERLKAIAAEREALINKVQRLEQGGKP